MIIWWLTWWHLFEIYHLGVFHIKPDVILVKIGKYQVCPCDRIYVYTDSILSKAQCSFRKGYSSQNTTIAMIEKWRRNLDQGGIWGVLFTDLSKAFDCLVHDFLIAKLEIYDFTYESLKLINSYLLTEKIEQN